MYLSAAYPGFDPRGTHGQTPGYCWVIKLKIVPGVGALFFMSLKTPGHIPRALFILVIFAKVIISLELLVQSAAAARGFMFCDKKNLIEYIAV